METVPTTRPATPVGLIALYLTAIVAANLLVAAYGPAIVIVNAFLFIGLDLTCRDALHDAWQYRPAQRGGRRDRGLWWKMALLIAAGSLLSWLLNRDAGPIALASFVAFAAASSADAAAYHLLRKHAWFVRANGSNVVGAAVDSVVFAGIAFNAWLSWLVLGQFIAKVLGGLVWTLILRRTK